MAEENTGDPVFTPEQEAWIEWLVSARTAAPENLPTSASTAATVTAVTAVTAVTTVFTAPGQSVSCEYIRGSKQCTKACVDTQFGSP